MYKRKKKLSALTVSFGETDLSVTERDGHARVSVTKTGQSRGNVTCTFIPLTLEQASLQYGHKVNGELDPAEIGKFYSLLPVVHEESVFFDQSTLSACL